MQSPTSGRTTSRSTRTTSTSSILRLLSRVVHPRVDPQAFGAPRRVATLSSPVLACVVGAQTRRELVVALRAIAAPGQTECGVAAHEVGLGVHHHQHTSSLFSFDRTDERPQPM